MRDLTPARRFGTWLSFILAFVALAAPHAAAQPGAGVPQVQPEFVEQFRRTAGDTITVCVNSESLLSGFEMDVARAVGQALLLNVEIVEFRGVRAPPVLDYTLGVNQSELFVLLNNDCHALAGFLLSETREVPWLTVSRPYAALSFAFATRLPNVRSLTDLPPGASVGTRIGSSADIAFAQYLESLPVERRLRRVPYPNNRLLLDRLESGEVDAILIWEPALHFGLAGGPTDNGLTVLDPGPVRLPEQRFGFALLSRESFLRSALDEALNLLIAEGVIDGLLGSHAIPGRAAR